MIFKATFSSKAHPEYGAAAIPFPNAESWRKLIKSHQVELATATKISPEQFRWYAAYHDADTHLHIHIPVPSKTTNPS